MDQRSVEVAAQSLEAAGTMSYTEAFEALPFQLIAVEDAVSVLSIPPTAATCVFSITELLVPILQGLGTVKEMFKARHVCWRWKAVIEDSEPLREIMFFRPVSEPLCIWAPGLVNSTFLRQEEVSESENQEKLEDYWSLWRRENSRSDPLGGYSGIRFPKESTLAGMFVTQPPTTQVTLTWQTCIICTYCDIRHITIKDDAGVKVGSLFKQVRAEKVRFQACKHQLSSALQEVTVIRTSYSNRDGVCELKSYCRTSQTIVTEVLFDKSEWEKTYGGFE